MWKQKGRTLTFTHKNLVINFDMPDIFDLNKVHIDLLKLAEWSLMYVYDKDIVKDHVWTRKAKGKNIGLAFSGGVDSTAALTLYEDYEDLHLFYMKRNERVQKIPRSAIYWEEGCTKRIYEFNKLLKNPVNIIETDMQMIRTVLENKSPGYSSASYYFVPIILMADILDIKYISSGSIFDVSYMVNVNDKNSTFKAMSISPILSEIRNIMKKAGLSLFLPVAPCPEVLTNIIVQQSKYKNIASCCVRKSDTLFDGCNKCPKCLRKKMYNGILLPLIPIFAEFFIEQGKKPYNGVIYANNKYKYNIPELKKYEKFDMSFLEKYYVPELDYMPEELQNDYIERISKYAEPMSIDLITFFRI